MWVAARAWRFIIIVSLLWHGLAIAAEEDFEYLPDLDTVQLRPQMRPQPYTASIYSVIADDLLKFVDNVLIFDSLDQYEMQPYVIGFDEQRNLGHVGNIAYTRGIDIRNDYIEYSLLRSGRKLVDPVTEEVIGIEAFVTGRAEVQKFDDPQTVVIKEALSAVEINTRLIPLVGLDLPSIIDVKYPSRPMTGYVLSIERDLEVGGAYMPVTISLGSKDCLRKGHVLDLVEKGREVTDPNTRNKVKVPLTKIGEVMIYKVGKKVSLGVVTYSDRAVLLNDKVMVLDQGY